MTKPSSFTHLFNYVFIRLSMLTQSTEALSTGFTNVNSKFSYLEDLTYRRILAAYYLSAHIQVGKRLNALYEREIQVSGWPLPRLFYYYARVARLKRHS